jgi:NADH:ubiquinone oxidoreductase subunit F (NADH-binding)
MKLDQIKLKAESENSFLQDKSCIKIYIASLPDNISGREIVDIFRAGVEKQGIKAAVITAGSFGYFDIEPIIIIEKPGKPSVYYKNADAKTALTLLDDYLAKENPRSDLAFCTTGAGTVDGIPSADSLPLFNLLKRIALRNCGYVDPGIISHYILREGYSGLSKVLSMEKAIVIETIRKSGLRGRGGAGYPTADKLKTCSDAAEKEKYVICNALDSDPKSNTARLLLTSDPHSFFEGLLISAYAVGAEKCIVYVDSEYSPAIRILENAISQMREFNLLGSKILDSDFSCEIKIIKAKRSMVSGEETAILRALEDKQAMPYLRPPFPETKGLHGKPTLISNIETLSNLSAIFQSGTDIISGIGTEKSKGTKVISYHGRTSINYTIEVPFGTSLRTIIEKMEGKADREIKAVQFGGPAGAYVNNDGLDMLIDFDKVREAGYIIGSGTIELIDKDTCALELTKKSMSYLHEQSCGKCVFCREGTLQISDMLEDISRGEGKRQDIGLINEISGQMKSGSICSFGRTAADPVLSAIKLFADEFDSHIKENRCLVKEK